MTWINPSVACACVRPIDPDRDHSSNRHEAVSQSTVVAQYLCDRKTFQHEDALVVHRYGIGRLNSVTGGQDSSPKHLRTKHLGATQPNRLASEDEAKPELVKNGI